MFCETASYTTLDSPKNVIHIPPAACWIPNWFLSNSQQKRVVFLWKRCDVAPVAGRQLVPSLCRTPDHSKSLIEAFLKSNPGDELFWTRHCPEGRGGSGGESDHVPRIAEERARVRHTFDGSSRLLSKSAQFDGLSNESSQLGLNLKAIMFPEWEREEKGGCRKVID